MLNRKIEASAIVGSNVEFLGSAYVGPNCVLGGPGFQHVDLLELYLGAPTTRRTVLGDRFVVMSCAVVGAGSVIGANFRGDAHILIGEDSVLGSDVVVEYGARVYDRVRIGDHSQIGGFVCNDSVIGTGCVVQGSLVHSRTQKPPERAPVIEDGALVGTGAIIVGEIVIARDSLIAAGSVVTSSTEAGYLYAGVPARRVKPRSWV